LVGQPGRQALHSLPPPQQAPPQQQHALQAGAPAWQAQQQEVHEQQQWEQGHPQHPQPQWEQEHLQHLQPQSQQGHPHRLQPRALAAAATAEEAQPDVGQQPAWVFSERIRAACRTPLPPPPAADAAAQGPWLPGAPLQGQGQGLRLPSSTDTAVQASPPAELEDEQSSGESA
jgi:hypothetical protein